MTTPNTTSDTRSVIVEKDYPHPPEKVWRALTESSLIEQWLMKNDFQPVAGRAFQLRMDPMPNWNGVVDCKVVTVDPGKTLAYTWGALGLESVVTFTLTPTDAGTHVHVEQSGFRPDQEAAYKGANYGWQTFLGKLEGVLTGIE
jgi:uncharacterized protein YndB with AHSA1/START domain